MKKWKNLSKRGLALLLALVMCMGMLQITAFAADEHVHNEDGWVCTQGESTRELVCDKHVHDENCYTTEQGELTCETEEHQHGDGCYEAAEPQLTCTEAEHSHDSGCYDEEGNLTCIEAEHSHSDSCYTEGEAVLTCEETEHTHGDGCYAVETVKVCEEEDHEHGDECYTVTEGEWTCTAPVAETPAEVQAFLDAVAAIPAASEVTADNAEVIGEQVDAALDMWDAMDEELSAREDVTEARKTVYAVYEAVLAAVDIDEANLYSTTWDGITVATEFAGGSGTESDPYRIANGAQLAHLKDFLGPNHSGKYFQLTADIDLGNQPWTPIGNGIAYDAFQGTLIGDGHTISNLNVTQSSGHAGLFGYIVSAEICNLTISNASVSGKSAGAFVGTASGSARLCNLHLRDSTVKSTHAAGGIVGEVASISGYTATICCSSTETGVTVQATTGNGYGVGAHAGGIVGDFSGSGGTVNIRRSYCSADSVTSANGCAGGILGSSAQRCDSTAPVFHISDCYNTADVSITGSPVAGEQNAAGGIAGFVWRANADIKYCYNTGTISTKNGTNASYAAGIGGYGTGLTYQNCVNFGTVTTGNTSTSTSRKPILGTINNYGGTVNSCWYVEGCLDPNVKTTCYTKTTNGTSATQDDAINKIATICQNNGDGWVLTGELPTLKRCVPANETACTCDPNCGCHCIPYNGDDEPTPPTPPEPVDVDYTLTYDANGGTFENGVTTKTDTVSAAEDAESVTFDIKDFAPEKENHTFKGWAATQGATEAEYVYSGEDGKDKVTFTPPAEGMKLYAVWEETKLTPPAPTYDLVVKKTIGESTDAAGDDIVTFTVTVENTSNVSLYNLMLVDTMDKTLNPTQDMKGVKVTVTGNDANTEVAFMGTRDDVKAPERDSNGHIVWTNEGGLTRTTGGEDKWDFTWMLVGEFKRGAKVELTYDAKIIYPEDADSVEYYNYADAIAGAEETDKPHYDGQQFALLDFVSGGSGGVGGNGGSGQVGGTRYKYTLTYDFSGGTWTQNGTTCSTYKVEKWSKNTYYDFTVDGSVQPEKDGYTFQNQWTEGGTTYSADSKVSATSANKNVTIYAVWAEKPSVTVNYVTDDGAPLGSIKYYPGQGAAYNHSVGDGTAVPTDGNASTRSPKAITVDGKTYTYDSVATKSSLTGTMGGESVTITVVYAEDAKGTIGTDGEGNPTDTSDGIPDKYQVKVTFKVENGEWNDGGKDDVVKYVVKYTDGTMNANGTAALGDIIPAAGNKPDEGYEAGSWNAEPTATTNVTEDTTYTYNYKAHVHNFEEETNNDGSRKWVKAPDCITDGTVKFVCSCGAEETRTVTNSALGHDFNGATPVDNCTSHSDANCTGHTLTCVRCNGTLKDGTKTEDHSYPESWTVTKQPTATERGEQERKCTACDHVEKQEIAALGEVTITIEYKDGDTVVKTEPVIVAKGEGYDVTNEIKIPEGYEPDGDPKNVTGTADGDKTVTVPVKKLDYTVTFDANGGSAVPSQSVKHGETAAQPAAPAREGYTFNGWTLDGADFSFNTPVTGNITLKAQWTRITTGGSGGGGSSTRYYDLTVSYVFEDGSQAAPDHTERVRRGSSYSVSSPAIEGFTPDQAVVSGTMPGRSLTVTVTYTANQVNIPEENPPLIDEPGTDDPTDNPPVVDIPNENPPLIDEPTIDIPNENPPLVDEPVIDIPEEDPPLVDIPENDPPLVDVPGDEPKLDGTPKTGDSSRTTLWAGLCAVSLAGIAVLTGKKKEDEEA